MMGRKHEIIVRMLGILDDLAPLSQTNPQKFSEALGSLIMTINTLLSSCRDEQVRKALLTALVALNEEPIEIERVKSSLQNVLKLPAFL